MVILKNNNFEYFYSILSITIKNTFNKPFVSTIVMIVSIVHSETDITISIDFVVTLSQPKIDLASRDIKRVCFV